MKFSVSGVFCVTLFLGPIKNINAKQINRYVAINTVINTVLVLVGKKSGVEATEEKRGPVYFHAVVTPPSAAVNTMETLSGELTWLIYTLGKQ